MTIQTNTDYNIRWETLHATIFLDLIIKLNEIGIKYFVLRNFEGLPQTNLSKDVDLIIEPGNYKKASKLLCSILKENGIKNYKVVRYERVRCCYGIDLNKNFSIHIDLIEGYLSKGFEVFSFDLLYRHTLEYNGFRVLDDSFDAIMLLYYKVIGTKQLKDQYKIKISSAYLKEQQSINLILQETLNSRCSSIIQNSLKNNDFYEIIKHAANMSKVSKKVAFYKKPLKTGINVIEFLIGKFYRIVICPSKYQNFIAVEGADGTGKTTFIEGLTNAIAYYYVAEKTKSHIYHFRPTLLPNLGAVGEKAGVMTEDKNFTNPHRAKPVGSFSSFFRMTYYWLDYLVGVPLKLRKDVQFDRFTIYDRYIYDFLVDPRRTRINLPYWLRKTFTRLVVQPRIVFVLLANAETIYHRKQELSISEINRQLNEFSKLAKTNKRFVVIDASKPPKEMVNDAMNVIIERFTQQLV